MSALSHPSLPSKPWLSLVVVAVHRAINVPSHGSTAPYPPESPRELSKNDLSWRIRKYIIGIMFYIEYSDTPMPYILKSARPPRPSPPPRYDPRAWEEYADECREEPPQLLCIRCGHTWEPRAHILRAGRLPKRCPHCASPRWNKPYIRNPPASHQRGSWAMTEITPLGGKPRQTLTPDTTAARTQLSRDSNLMETTFTSRR